MNEKLIRVPFYRDTLVAYKVCTSGVALNTTVVVQTDPAMLARAVTVLLVRILRACMRRCLQMIAIACVCWGGESREDWFVFSLVQVLNQQLHNGCYVGRKINFITFSLLFKYQHHPHRKNYPLHYMGIDVRTLPLNLTARAKKPARVTTMFLWTLYESEPHLMVKSENLPEASKLCAVSHGSNVRSSKVRTLWKWPATGCEKPLPYSGLNNMYHGVTKLGQIQRTRRYLWGRWYSTKYF